MKKCSYPGCNQRPELTVDKSVKSQPVYTKRKDRNGNIVDDQYIKHAYPTMVKTGRCFYHNQIADGLIERFQENRI